MEDTAAVECLIIGIYLSLNMQTLEISHSNMTLTFGLCFHLTGECIRKALTPALLVADFRRMSVL